MVETEHEALGFWCIAICIPAAGGNDLDACAGIVIAHILAREFLLQLFPPNAGVIHVSVLTLQHVIFRISEV